MGGFSWSHILGPLLTPSSQVDSALKAEIEALHEADHTYIRGHEDQRSPCPFLNSLANHNYLPRDGNGITRDKLKAALIAAGNTTPLFANVLTSVVKPLAGADGTWTLVDLRKHNVVEHDASFTRLDAKQGNNYSFQPEMFEMMMRVDAKGGPINADSIARTRKRRDLEEKKLRNGSGVTFWGSPRLYFTTWSQTCILLETFGPEISVEDITTLYTEERLPDWWMPNPRRMTLVGQLAGMAKVWWKTCFVKVEV